MGGALISQGVWLKKSDHTPSSGWLFLVSAIFSLRNQTTPSLPAAVERYDQWVGGAWQISGCVGLKDLEGWVTSVEGKEREDWVQVEVCEGRERERERGF